MTDLGSYTPGQACIAAREALLEGIVATWPQKRPKPKPVPEPPRDLMMIDIEGERAAVARLFKAWQEALAEKVATVLYASQNKVDPGEHYWQAEAKARARWVIAANFLELLEAARR